VDFFLSPTLFCELLARLLPPHVSLNRDAACLLHWYCEQSLYALMELAVVLCAL
jgi:hypothetical protein